jgi:2-methylcitrate dehydratase PrpD
LAALSIENVPDAAFEHPIASIVDTVGVALAGSHEPATRIQADVSGTTSGYAAWDLLRRRWSPQPTGTASPDMRSTMATGAFAVLGHPSIVVLSSALALGQATRATGADVMNAYVVGAEVMTKLARATLHRRLPCHQHDRLHCM